MSKHPSNNVKSRLLRRGLAGILSLALILGLMPGAVFTADAASWADPYVNTLVDWGVMRGDVGGNMAPNRSITRAEFVTMMNRAYGYSKMGGHPFADVSTRDWYYEDIDIAYNIGYFQGTAPTLASPNAPLTREQAAVLLSRNMMLQPTVGETLGFSDSRSLSDWSRGLVGAAAANGIISGYDDGSFQPFRNITRGEVAAMLVRAIGTPVQTPGDHALGNVYGNVTVNTSGVKLRDGVIVGNLYLTGGIDLGEVLLENVTVLGEIIVSGGGESNSSQSSIIMRNVVADNLVVDSIGDQFVTLRVEGNTDIPTAVVRTNAYVDDSSLPGYGLNLITLDGENGALYQLAGNIKEVVNKTPGSSLQVVQGIADKVTVDEYATGSSVLVDGDAQVGDLNLDTATNVTGTGDIGKLNVGAAGSTVEQLPDNIEIRPGITTDINGGTMDSTQAAESSADPKLLAGYPAVKNIAPTSATAVFKTNKTGTIYWAVSAVADGSVTEADLLEPPAYGGNVLVSGNVKADAANKEFTAAVSKLTSGGSYYLTAMLVDGRGEHSPIKVTSFSTPDDTVPAFASGYPVMSKITCDEAQVTVMTTKSCLLYYALLPAGAAAPKAEEFKSAAIPGNLGYGSMSVTKNVTIPFPVNNTPLDEKTNYVLYLWLTDHDGAKSSSVVRLPFTTPDETPPNVTSITQTGETVSSIRVTYTIDEPADLVWAIVTEADHMSKRFLAWDDETFDPNDDEHSTLKFNSEADLLAAKIKMQSGAGAIQAGEQRTSPLNISNLLTQNTNTSSYVLYYMANDHATTTGNLSTQIKALRVHTLDNTKPTAKLLFTNPDGTQVDDNPQLTADVSIIFSENVKGGTKKGENVFLTLYDKMQSAYNALYQNPSIDPDDQTTDEYIEYLNARSKLTTALSSYITMYSGTPSGSHTAMKDRSKESVGENDTWIDWRYAVVEMLEDGRVEVRLPGPKVNADGTYDYSESGLKLDSGASYYFHLAGIYDLSVATNPLDPSPCDLPFTTSFAKVLLTPGDELTMGPPTGGANNDRNRIDYHFIAEPQNVENMNNSSMRWDMLIWADTSMVVTLYKRHDTTGSWTEVGQLDIAVDESEGFAYRSVSRWTGTNAPNPTPDYALLQDFKYTEYAVHIDKLKGEEDFTAWNQTVSIRVSIVAGTQSALSNNVINGLTQADYDKALELGVLSVGTPDPFTMSKLFTDSKAPDIDDRPTIDAHDTNAEIYMTLNRPGQVYYLAIPLKNLSTATNTLNSAIELVESDVKQVVSYSPAMSVLKGADQPALGTVPLMRGDRNWATSSDIAAPFTVDRPRRDDFIATTTYDGVIKGTTPSVSTGARATINLSSGTLEPNTVYLLCLLTRGVSAVYSDDIYCYRFTTTMPERPSLSLQNTGSTAVDAIADRTTPVKSVLLIESALAGDLLNEPFVDHVKPELKDAYKALNKDDDKYTVLNAMYENDGGSQTATGLPSIFDTYADEQTKQSVRQTIETTATGDLVKGYWGPENINVTGNATSGKVSMNFNNFQLQENVNYICIAYAGSAGISVESCAFRATYPIQVVNDKKPSVQSVGLGLQKPDADGKTSGEIFINFDQDLYRVVTGFTGRHPVAHYVGTSAVPDKDGFSNLVGCVTYPANIRIPDNEPHSTISTIQLRVEDCQLTRIPLNVRGLYNRWGTPIDPIDINIQYTEADGWTYTITTGR